LIYNGSQIIKLVLEKWNDTLTEDEKNQIKWYSEEIKNSSGNVSSHHHDE